MIIIVQLIFHETYSVLLIFEESISIYDFLFSENLRFLWELVTMFPDSSHTDASHHFLFYVEHQKHILNTILNGPQSNADVYMMHLINKEKYQLLKFWFDKTMELDDIEWSLMELLFEYVCAHFQEMDDYDNEKSLGFLADRLRGGIH
jgi:hypothetical protein